VKPPIQIIKTETGCLKALKKTAPKIPTFHADGPEEGCPETWEACLGAEDADNVGEFIEASTSWIAQAIDACSKKENEQ
jgi:hypothetical protein